jgi:peptidoglycan/xylan/chitin deacetylase (PgdA/CDA1 family)
VPPAPLVADLVHRVRTSDPVVFLTIDDGAVRTASDLAMIRRLGLPIAAFPTGAMVNADPGYWVATGALARSHVYTHTYRHVRLPGLSLAAQTREICRGAAATAAVVGTAPALFRPPYGESDATTLRAAGACGMAHVVLWDVVVADGHVTTWRGPLAAGDIVILHYTKHLAADLGAIVRDAASHHLRFGDLAAYADRLV